jgi:hypothetical protein
MHGSDQASVVVVVLHISRLPPDGSAVSVVKAFGSALIGLMRPAPHSTHTSDHLNAWNIESASQYLPSPLRVDCQAQKYPGAASGRPSDPSIIGLFLLAEISKHIHFVFHTNHIKYTITMGFSEVHTEVPKTAIHLVGTDDWQADLAKNGYAVVKGAVPKERAADYTERMHQYLEG